ncbi:MAG: hypothetical protein BGP06_18005 [Rhizobiales bacterium 65-9]|nr:DUF721 domain-containing protein [Hyphomicrobiales bacterium]OJY34736.1 MAG: hypothetical protein BGP06_18005 [Rhizobiales bacterium 65-9]
MSVSAKPRRAARPLADLVDSCLGAALAKQGFAGADIVLSWPEIVGEALARRSRPVRIAWPRKPSERKVAGRHAPPPEPATLHVRVESAFALELQHLAPIVIERVNAYFGWACVGRLRLEQGPVRRGAALTKAARPPSPEAVAAAEQIVADVADEGLRAALARLGAAVIDRERGARTKT